MAEEGEGIGERFDVREGAERAAYLLSRPVRATDVPAVIERLETPPAATVRAFSNPTDSAH